MATNNDPPVFRAPEPQPYNQPNWQPSQRPPFEPAGFVSPVAGATVNPWQTGNELFRSELGVDWLRTSDPLRGFKW
jgi:hypothetical protein